MEKFCCGVHKPCKTSLTSAEVQVEVILLRLSKGYMHLLGRIKLPKSVDVSKLYVQCNEGASINYHEGEKEIVLRQGGIISSNSYFNAFYEQYYVKYTNLQSIYYLLKLEGDFQVSVYREVYGGNNRDLISIENFDKCQSDYVKVLLPELIQTETAGRIYLEIMCSSEHGLFKEGLIATEQDKIREVSLGIITCTFKKEAYIRNTLNTILQDNLLQNKDLKIFVVDNGRTLNEDDLKDPRVQLIPNRNVGGSGGFTRGLIEALQSNSLTHFLLMDDDIELDSECIYRLFSLYEYANFDFAVAGTMLDLYKKHIVYEAGAAYGKAPKTMGFDPFSLVPLKNNLDLENTTSLNLFLLEESVDYGGFWFFSFPRKVVEKIGLLMPFFIKVDDVEFGLRIKESFGSIVAFPSIAVWHEPFYAKSPSWDTYYHYRNDLITHAIHGSLGYINTVKYITKALIFSLLFFDYNSAEMLVKAFEDYVKGPGFLKNMKEPDLWHFNILKLSKSYDTQKVQQNYLPQNQFEPKPRSGILNQIASLLTLNGHLLPNFLTSDDEVFIWHGSGNPGQLSRAFAKKKVIIFNEEKSSLFENEIDKLAGIKLFTRWLKVAARNSINWSSISTEWKNASTELISTRFWQQYLGLNVKI